LYHPKYCGTSRRASLKIEGKARAALSDIGTELLPLRVAIVGSGPSGFYAAEALFKAGAVIDVDMFDRLPTPFGLVRGGVAPDHHKIKGVTRIYDRIASNERFRFMGNVTVGEDITIPDMRNYYDAILFAYGAETDRRLGIPGEDTPGSHTATEFVGWYNGHPDYRDRAFDLSQEVAVVIGQGNVAMDVTRILAKTVDELRETDIAQHALDALAESNVKEIHLIGRRGPVQAKFTPPEIREIGELADCDPIVDPADLELGSSCQAELDDQVGKPAEKNFEILQRFAATEPRGKSRRCVIQFYRSPIEIQGDGHVQRLVLSKNRLEGEPFKQRAIGTGETTTMPCGLVFRSVGYHGVGIPDVPFDEASGVIPNEAGRVMLDDETAVGLYVAGWIKRGPSGVIGTNKPDSQETVGAILSDYLTLPQAPERDSDAVVALLNTRGVRVVSYDDWRAIDAAEIKRGEAVGKPREKFTRTSEMLAVLH
jgi:ferredoxin/flavodoxin---NADP+ reductase